MNTLAWVAAVVASIALTYHLFTEDPQTTEVILGFASLLVVCFCLVMTIDALLDDIRTGGGLGH